MVQLVQIVIVQTIDELLDLGGSLVKLAEVGLKLAGPSKFRALY